MKGSLVVLKGRVMNMGADTKTGIVMSDPSGNALDFEYYSGDDGSEDVYGCTDPDACNYNPDANMDDGSCTGPYLCDDMETLVCDLDDCLFVL